MKIWYPHHKKWNNCQNNHDNLYSVGIVKSSSLTLNKNGTWISHADGSKSRFLKNKM